MSAPTDMQNDPRLDANLSNWRNVPNSRWAFHNVDKLIPSKPITSDSANALPLANDSKSFDSLQIPAGRDSTIGFSDFLRRTCTDGFVVVADGKLVCEFYDNGTTAHTPHILMSASKSVTGLVAGILQDKGQLDIDAPVSTYVPEIARTAYRDATLRHLMDMRTGVRFDAQHLAAYAQSTGWEPVSTGKEATGLHQFFASATTPFNAHDGAFSYVSANTDLLGWAIERATGESFASLASELLWKPMGAEDDAYITVDSEGAPRCTGGLCATTRDLARLGQLMVEGGKRGSQSIVPESWIDDIANNGDHDAWKQGEFAPLFARMNMRYRSGWYVVDDEPKTLFAMGIYGQNLFIDRANRLVVAKVSSQKLPIDPTAVGLTLSAVAAIRRLVA
jgi:CubicO group peptidase (beta-lactamase class C family)